jgi:hypothetical protein
MREIFTSGTVGGAPGNRCFYPEIHILLPLVFDPADQSKKWWVFFIDIDKRLAYLVSALMLGYGLVHVRLSERDASG